MMLKLINLLFFRMEKKEQCQYLCLIKVNNQDSHIKTNSHESTSHKQEDLFWFK